MYLVYLSHYLYDIIFSLSALSIFKYDYIR